MQQTNEQLEQKAEQLAERNVEVERKNQEIEQARRALEEKATELALTSKYKSEFLANMSHELRTPLNSILILGQQLADNPDGNLTAKQVEFARTIHGAGTDLLNLISDILDLSKIESGTVTVEPEEISFANLLESPPGHSVMRRKHADWLSRCSLDPNLGRSITTDSKRLQQVLKNLLSNAFKFTAQGGVRLKVAGVRAAGAPTTRCSTRRRTVVAFEVSDTGIGIPREAEDHLRGLPAGRCRHQPQIRRHRSRAGDQPRAVEPAGRRNPAAQHARRGQHVHAVLPLHTSARAIRAEAGRALRAGASRRSPLPAESAESSRSPTIGNNLQPGDSILLIVEDDPHYARIMVDLARDKGFKVLVAMRGIDALELASSIQPTAVSLDVFLPDMLGWTVLSQLKQDPLTRHIPVQILTLDEDRQHGMARGAFSFVTKPTTTEGVEEALARIKEYAKPRRKRLLVVEDDPAEQLSISELLGHDDIEIDTAATGAEALHVLRDEALRLRRARSAAAGHGGFRGAGGAHDDAKLSDVPWWCSPAGNCRRRKMRSCTPWRAASSSRAWNRPSGLLDETALFLHRVVTELPPEKQSMLERLNAPTRTWSDEPCCWSTMTRATSSLCRACWSGAACGC